MVPRTRLLLAPGLPLRSRRTGRAPGLRLLRWCRVVLGRSAPRLTWPGSWRGSRGRGTVLRSRLLLAPGLPLRLLLARRLSPMLQLLLGLKRLSVTPLSIVRSIRVRGRGHRQEQNRQWQRNTSSAETPHHRVNHAPVRGQLVAGARASRALAKRRGR
jgi:hypothetical protein